jgi:alpha-ketoglutarate-dependent 2,4-dichlorophenoxyacetate dioxygenase
LTVASRKPPNEAKDGRLIMEAAEAFQRRPLNDRFGVELWGVAVGPAMAQSAVDAVRNEAMRNGVAVLRGQSLTDADLQNFAERMGSLRGAYADGTPALVTGLSNMDDDGNILPADHRSMQLKLANEFWHADSTYVRPRATLSMLYAQAIPPEGGDTEFCDTRVLYESLSPAEKSRFDGLTATHSFQHSRRLSGVADWSEAELSRFPPVDRPFIHLHAESGRRAVCLASHIAHLSGVTDDETRAIVTDLTARATRPELVYAHRWAVGDLVLWDNRCMMHRGRPYDALRHRRNLRTIRLIDLADA